MCGEHSAALAAGQSESLRLPVELLAPGGGLLVLSVEAAKQRFWLPLLTQVEDVPAVLESVERILGDTPDAAASARLAELRKGGGEWRVV